MRLNTRGRYGLQLLSQLACHLDDSKPVGLKDIARTTGLPWRNLEQIAGPLRKASLIAGRPGRAVLSVPRASPRPGDAVAGRAGARGGAS